MTARASPFRVAPPAIVDRVEWPDDFGTRFIVWCDVEEEFDWSAPLDRRNVATNAMAAFPDAHRRFASLGTGLACMVDHPVAIDPRAVDILRRVLEDGRSSVGAQLHAWVTPPYAAPTPGDSYAGNLPSAVEAAKLDTITAALTEAFGASPLAYRAGRYGIGPATMGLLASRGYRIDSSVRARYDYRDDGGPDFSAVGNHAYRVGPIVELPLTTVFTGAFRGIGASLHARAGGVPAMRALLARSRLLRRVALTPEDMPIADALEAVEIAIGEGTRLLNLSFHSPTLLPGNTPYVRDAEDLRRFWRWWDAMLGRLAARDVLPVTTTEIDAAIGRPV